MPIILCTGFSSKIASEGTQQLNVDSLLMKPIIIREMAQTIRKVLDYKCFLDKVFLYPKRQVACKRFGQPNAFMQNVVFS
jgi:hypothetical protein